MKPLIHIENLTKTFRNEPAVDHLSLDVPEGSITAFLGPNGAGKTTTIKCLLNLLERDGGRVEVLGCDARQLGPEQFQQIGYVSENQQLPLWMTVQQFLDYCRPMYPNWDTQLESKMQRDFDLPPTRQLKALSRGMLMKAALLSSLAYRPKLVVLDEPFSGLDPLVRDEFLRGLLELTGTEGWTVFISSHDVEEVERLADRVAIINRGRVELDESATSLQQRFRSVEGVVERDLVHPAVLPDSWINFETAGRSLRFVDTNYDDQRLRDDLTKHLPGIRLHEVRALTLRETFIALAKTYRLAAPLKHSEMV